LNYSLSSSGLIDWEQTAIPFLIGTKFDTFSTFPRDEQEEITKQVWRLSVVPHHHLTAICCFSGKALRQSNARVAHFLFDAGIDKCPENFQNRAGKSVRLEMCHSGNRGCWGAGFDLC
jgi:hypothetical protein